VTQFWKSLWVFDRRCVLWVLLLLSALDLIALPIRVAILPTSSAVAPPADVLTASFSQLPNTQLFERDQLRAIVREHSLQAARLSDTIAAMRVAGADALLILEPSHVGTNNGVAVRLIAIGSGAILEASHVRWPVDDLEKWVKAITAQYATPLARIAVPGDRLVKISLLNFSSPSSTAAAQLLDRELATLIRLRLSREPEIIVLERQEMLALAFEKELAAATEKFWTGSYLLGGSVNRDASTTNTVTLDLELTPPAASAQKIHLEGSRRDLPALANSVAAAVLKCIQRVSAVSWSPASEAKAYLDEAQWATRWQMWPEAISAADAAWSLGAQDLDAAIVRLLAYARGGQRYNWRWTAYSINGQEFHWPVYPPDPTEIPTFLEGLNFVNEILARYPAALADQSAYRAVCETIFLAGDLLHNYYFRAEARLGHEEQLAEIRRLAREISSAVMRDPRVLDLHRPTNLARDRSQEEIHSDIFALQVQYGVFFNETPEDTAALYRDVIKNHWSQWYDAIFEKRETDFAPVPLFGGWKWKDRARADDVLVKFAKEMRGGPVDFIQFLHRADMDLALAPTPEQKKVQEEFLKGQQEQLHRMMEARTNRPMRSVTNRVVASVITNRPPAQVPASPDEPKVLSSRPLTESDFWVIPLEKISEQTRDPNVTGGFMQWLIVRNGHLWFHFYYTYWARAAYIQPPSYGDCLVGLNLHTFEPKVIPLDRPEFKRGFIWSAENRSFEVTSNAFYFVHNDRLLRRSIDAPEWTEIPISMNSPLLFLVHDSLYLSGEEGIQKFEGNGAFKTLASARRRPAQSALDNLEAFGRPILYAAGRETLRAAFKDRQFLFDGSSWKEEFALPPYSIRKGEISPFFSVRGQPNGGALLWSPPDSAPQVLGQTPDYNGPAVSGGPQWKLNYQQVSHCEPFVMGDTPALLVVEKVSLPFAFKRGSLFDMLVFSTNAPFPIHLPLDLPKSKMPGFDQKVTLLQHGGPFVIDSPTEVFFSAPEFDGLWRIPKAEIQKRIEETIATHNRATQPVPK
jgi:hypothetical protein